MIISLISQKGGVGKSAIARLLAVEYIRAGWSVKIADLDTMQGTVTKWRVRRDQAKLTPEIPVEPREGGQFRVVRGSVRPVSFVYQCGCYNSRPAKGEFTVSDYKLVEHGIVGGFIY